ncbi:hypothetical protein CTAYLR_004582 [Chrysophaeum taylorii]|uniref:Uncharacterized protein n=1 Tax=Chrysophaeum taylorii TaxID=2483200 RepID=A0AAD7UDK5_9STRA|nr:hypothetical protein CTAYLR_004582 [Chrysophaeum taylorii]
MVTGTELYIVGCGVLGLRIGSLWPGPVYGETRTTARHDELRAAGIIPRLSHERHDCDNVLFCAPPSAFEDYAGAVAEAKTRVLISSGGVFAEDDGGVCTELSSTSSSPRAVKILKAEEQAPIVLRLAGLYDLHRGPHEYWFRKGIAGPPDSLVNLLAYDDAARAAVAVLLEAQPGDLLLAADMAPRTRRQIVEAARIHPDFRGRTVEFSEEDPSRGPKGKGRTYDCSFTKSKLNWEPKFPSIEAFFRAHHS